MPDATHQMRRICRSCRTAHVQARLLGRPDIVGCYRRACIAWQGAALAASLPRPEIAKFAMIIMLAVYGCLYLALCFYTVHVSGSTDGLVDIGQAAVLTVAATALAVAAGLRTKELTVDTRQRRSVRPPPDGPLARGHVHARHRGKSGSTNEGDRRCRGPRG